MTGAERQWATQYEPGDVIRYTRGSKHMRIEAGSYATVVRVNQLSNEISVEQSGNILAYDPRRLAGITVYREIEREFAVGDRIQFTAPDKSLGVANRDMATIESITPEAKICVRLDGGRQLEFDAQTHRHFDHGYAVTSHSAQGLTAERVLINADTGVHPDLLNSRFGYVAVSRASHSVTIFTDQAHRFDQRLATDVTKSSALEITQSSSVTRDQSMGMSY